MSIPHTVKVGDSLWSLAHRYLGSGTRWPDIEKYHNQQAALPGRPMRLLPIQNPNLIYIGQTIMIPPRTSQSAPGAGLRRDADQIAQGVDLKVVYKLEGPENQYRRVLPHCIIEAKMSGTIAIENVMHDRYEHNLELSLDKHGAEAKHKLGRFSDHAFRDLTQGVALDFDSGRVTLQAPIMYKAGLGPFTIEVKAESPTTLKGTLKPEPMEATATLGRKRYKYSADVQFEVTVTMNPANRKGPGMARQNAPRKQPIAAPEKSIDWEQIAQHIPEFLVSITIIAISVVAWQTRMIPSMESTTTTGPFLHTIPMDQPGMI